jgi:hypothetical protein
MASKLDKFMAEVKAFDYKWFDEIGGNEALAEIGRLREQASGTTTLAPDVAYWLCQSCGCANYKDLDDCGDCHAPRR